VATRTDVLVTGGAGYIGSHTCKALHGDGFCPVVYDNLSTGNAWAVKWGPLIQGDLADRDQLTAALQSSGADTVIHFAASAYVGESMREPGKYFRNNVANTLNLLEAMVAAGVRRIVFSSSCAIYGVPRELPITEESAQRPVNAYGDSKLMCERLIRWFGEAHGLEWMILRYFNAAGADPDGEIGECHDPEPHLIPIILEAARTGGAVHVYGTDYATQDGSAVRDYVHVTDLAQAHLLAVGHLLRGGSSTALNLGTGVGTSVKQTIQAVEHVTGKRIAVECRPRRAGDPPALLASANLARETIGWVPAHCSIETTIRHAWEWHTQQFRHGAGEG